jgi:site-specific DNA-cytosine methylase
MAGKRLNFNDPRSKLFYQYARLLQETKPKFFLMENVLMKEEWEIQISNELGVYPVKINSSLVSAQNRRRNYWANFPISQPDDRKIFWKDIQLDDATDVYYMTEKMMTWIWEDPKRRDRFKIYDKDTKEKMQMLEASHYKGISNQRCFSIQDKGLRYIHPIECERLQNIPDDYTAGVSRTQRYKMLGNSWTTGVVSHIFKGLLCSS